MIFPGTAQLWNFYWGKFLALKASAKEGEARPGQAVNERGSNEVPTHDGASEVPSVFWHPEVWSVSQSVVRALTTNQTQYAANKKYYTVEHWSHHISKYLSQDQGVNNAVELSVIDFQMSWSWELKVSVPVCSHVTHCLVLMFKMKKQRVSRGW